MLGVKKALTDICDSYLFIYSHQDLVSVLHACYHSHVLDSIEEHLVDASFCYYFNIPWTRYYSEVCSVLQ